MAKKKPTQEEIIQEVGEVSSQWNQGDKPAMQDPIVWRDDYKTEDIINGRDPKLIKNGSMNKDAYGDDGNGVNNVDIPEMYGGKNDKYMGEGTRNTFEAYNPNITTADLDPTYKYGVDARMANSAEANYIAKRNDNIASALYNEGRTSMQDVADFLNTQEGFRNSTEGERQNTIASIWKRIGEKGEKGQPQEEEKKEQDLSKADSIVEDTSGKLYGKTTADSGKPVEGIDTLSDENSVFKSMQEDRARNLENLITIAPEDIATALDNGLLPGDLQSIRDLQQYYPEIWSEVKQYQKKIKAQNEVDSITKGEWDNTGNSGQSVINNSNADFANKNSSIVKSSQEITEDVNNALAKNQTAQEASETMSTIEEDMAILKNRLKNLRTEANAAFKGDVPDYIVNAYINNRTQEIQNQMQILEDRYNMAYNRYKDEVANTQREKEYQLKVQQLQLQKDSAAIDKWYKEQGLAIEWYKLKGDESTTNPGDSYPVTTLSDEEVANAVDSLLTMFDNGELGNAQCAAGIQKYYLPKLGIELSNLSSRTNKKKLINEGSGYTPKKGDLIIIDSGAKLEDGTLAGHIGIVIGVTKDGYVQYLDWNGSLDKNGKGTEKAAINGIQLGSSKIAGFRNVNKKNSDMKFTTGEYDAFQKYLNSDLSASEQKQLESRYGYKDNPSGMTEFVRNALNNRLGTSDDGTQGDISGYDSELGYNPYMKDVYESYLKKDMSDSDIKGYERTLGEGELGRQALNYAKAKESGIDFYDDSSRNVDESLGYILGKEDIYRLVQENGYKVPGTQESQVLSALGISAKDPKKWDKVVTETKNWEKANDNKFEALKQLIREVEYIMSQDADLNQRILAKTWAGDWIFGGFTGEANAWKNAYNLIKGNQVLDEIAKAKANGINLYPMSDQDIKTLKDASSNIHYDDETPKFRGAINAYYNELRKQAGLGELTETELADMWNTEKDKDAKWDNYAVLQYASYGGKQYRLDSNGKKIYYNNTSGYTDYEDIDGSNLGGGKGDTNNSDNDSTKNKLFPTG